MLKNTKLLFKTVPLLLATYLIPGEFSPWELPSYYPPKSGVFQRLNPTRSQPSRQCDGQREEIKGGKEEEVLHEVSRTHKVSGKQGRGGCCEAQGGMVQMWVTESEAGESREQGFGFCQGEELVKPARNGLERMMKSEG